MVVEVQKFTDKYVILSDGTRASIVSSDGALSHHRSYQEARDSITDYYRLKIVDLHDQLVRAQEHLTRAEKTFPLEEPKDKTFIGLNT